MTTIIDYVVLNATFSSTTINLVNLDSSVFFLFDDTLTCSRWTEYAPDIVIQLVQLIWSHEKRPTLRWKILKDADIRLFPNMTPVLDRSKAGCNIDSVIIMKILLFL